MTRFWNRLALIALGLVLAASAALEPAMAGIGEPSMWQMNMQPPVTEVARDISDLHDILIWVITAISLFVLGLLIYVMVKFNEKANPVPSKLTHNTLLEVAWILIPCLILVYIAIPSFKLLRLQIELPKPDITVKAIGHQWYWSYEYGQDQNGGFAFDSYMLSREDAVKANQPALLAVDNELRGAGAWRRCDPQFCRQLVRDPHGCRAGPDEPDMVQDRQRRRVLRPVLASVRSEPCLHADRCPHCQPREIRGLAG